MKKNQPHGIRVGCEYEILSRPKVKLKTTNVEGWITMGEGRTKITIPMRSWVKNFIDRLHNILDGTATDTEIATASLPASSVGAYASISDKAGVLIGTDDTTVTLNDTGLGVPILETVQTQYSTTTLIKPYQDGRYLYTGLRRLFSNASSSDKYVYEIGIKSKKTASTASNAGGILIARDLVPGGQNFEALTDTRVEILLKAQLPVTGGPVLNMLRTIFNLMLAGSANYSAWVPLSGTVTLTHGAASATSPLVVDGTSSKYWGIIVGYRDKNLDEIDIDGDTNITLNAGELNLYSSELTYGANTVSAVTQSGNRASFYVTRDITNPGTSNYKIERIGLLAKGATAAPTTIENGQIFLCMNKPSEVNDQGRNQILLEPNQTLRVTYTFEIDV